MTAQRPPARLPDGSWNPEYTAYRKKLKGRDEAAKEAMVVTETPADERAAMLAELDEPETASIRVVKLPRNDRFVTGQLPTGELVPVLLRRRGTGQKMLRKTITATLKNGQYVQA